MQEIDMTDSTVPSDRTYTEKHEWALEQDGVYSVGITHYAQDQLGEIVELELPDVGDSVTAGEPFGTVDSVKTFSDLYAPVSGEVVEVNDSLMDAPEALNEAPYQSWLVRIRAEAAPEGTLDAKAYSSLIEEL